MTGMTDRKPEAEKVTDEAIREKAARAIHANLYAKNGGNWDANETKERWRMVADAALTACGYWEMRRALKNISLLYERDMIQAKECRDIAIAALSKAGET